MTAVILILLGIACGQDPETTYVTLDPCVRLHAIAWGEDGKLSTLVRPMKGHEVATSYVFTNEGSAGFVPGTSELPNRIVVREVCAVEE